MRKGWIGFDFDGTLARYDGWKGADVLGEPVESMVALAKEYLANGHDVRIITARASHDSTTERMLEAQRAIRAVAAWALEHIGQELVVTCSKDYSMTEFYDDRCQQVEHNTGRIITDGYIKPAFDLSLEMK